jgi:hypothetical protein
MNKEQKREQAVIDLINEMFSIAGHDVTYNDIKDRKDDWYQQYTMTESQHDEWKKWGKKYLQKTLRTPSKMAEREIQWFSLQYGLKIDFNEKSS